MPPLDIQRGTTSDDKYQLLTSAWTLFENHVLSKAKEAEDVIRDGETPNLDNLEVREIPPNKRVSELPTYAGKRTVRRGDLNVYLAYGPNGDMPTVCAESVDLTSPLEVSKNIGIAIEDFAIRSRARGIDFHYLLIIGVDIRKPGIRFLKTGNVIHVPDTIVCDPTMERIQREERIQGNLEIEKRVLMGKHTPCVNQINSTQKQSVGVVTSSEKSVEVKYEKPTSVPSVHSDHLKKDDNKERKLKKELPFNRGVKAVTFPSLLEEKNLTKP